MLSIKFESLLRSTPNILYNIDKHFLIISLISYVLLCNLPVILYLIADEGDLQKKI